MGVRDAAAEIVRLFDAGYGITLLSSFEEGRAREAAVAAAASLDVPLRTWTAAQGLEPPLEARGGLAEVLAELRAARPSGVVVFFDLSLTSLSALERRLLRELIAEGPLFRQYVLVVSPLGGIPDEMQREVAMVVLPPPDEAELVAALTETCQGLRKSMTKDQAAAAITAARGLGLEEARRAFRLALRAGGDPTSTVLAEKRRLLRRSAALDCVELGADELAGLSVVGGLDVLKGWLRDRQKSLTPEARAFGLPPPKGLLLIGVQGCGKSLCAKAVAAQWRLPLARLDLAGLFAGEVAPEAALRQSIAAAEAMAPSVLWVDEIEKGFAGVDSGRDTGLARLFGWFITWLAERTSAVFVVATGNEVANLPPELLRKGRFDETFFVDLPDPRSREAILAIHLKRRKRDPAKLPLAAIAGKTEHFSGSELEQVVVSGLHAAFSQGRDLLAEDLERAALEIVPLYRTYEERIKALRDWAKDRARSASADVKLVDYFQRS
ncbi:MAG TPA: AAA family ATPase [Myxococcales bacterium]|nr:AAA family ATPase [Myxococcales bacterium]